MTQPTLNSCPSRPRRTQRWGMFFGSLLVLAMAVAARYYWGLAGAAAQAPQSARPAAKPVASAATPAAQPASSPKAQAASPTKATVQAPDASTLKVMAVVNDEQISREDLARDCLRHYGREVLERLVNRHLIIQECKRRNISVTPTEVNQEIERMSSRFGLPTDQWLELLRKERGIHPNQYAADIIWPTLALRKLAGDRLQVTPEEVQREYESLYGPSIKARLIVCDNLAKAQSVRAQAVAHPDAFGNLAKQHSIDPSASLKGVVQPIRKNSGQAPLQEKIEQVAFTLKDGEISPVISLANQHVLLKREEELPARKVPMTDQLRTSLEEIVRDRKLQTVASDTFARLQKEAQVERVFEDPAKSQQMPGVAAVINGQQITLRELSELCLDRHGHTALEGAIHRRLLEQACKKANVTVTEADLDAEIARAAANALPPKADGSPDVQGWLTAITQEQRVPLEIYRHDSVWPSVALKKLVGDTIEVTEEDIQKGFQANYGPRVRCRAIVLDNLRRAQQVWDLARKAEAEKPRQEAEAYFGELAEQYSIETSSRTLKGEVPPIQRYGGQPLLEKEAFELQPGRLSSVIQVDSSRFVILYCLGQTQPVQVELAEVRNQIAQDVHEKKLRLAMADRFDQIKEQATIDNFLAGSSHEPKRKAAQAPARAGTPIRR